VLCKDRKAFRGTQCIHTQQPASETGTQPESLDKQPALIIPAFLLEAI